MDENSCCHLMSNHLRKLTSACDLLQTTKLKASSLTPFRSSCFSKRRQDTMSNVPWTLDVHKVLCAVARMVEQCVFCLQEQVPVVIKQRSDALISKNTGYRPECNRKSCKCCHLSWSKPSQGSTQQLNLEHWPATLGRWRQDRLDPSLHLPDKQL